MSRLVEAVRNDSFEKIKEIAQTVHNIDEKEKEEGMTSLMEACRNNELEIAEWLIKKGANVNEKNMYNWRPLVFAVGINQINVEMCKLLIENGSDICIKSINSACWIGSLGVIRLFVEKGAELSQKVDGNLTAIALLARNDHWEVLEYLEETKMKLTKKDQEELKKFRLKILFNKNR